jgi:hypothetical protein
MSESLPKIETETFRFVFCGLDSFFITVVRRSPHNSSRIPRQTGTPLRLYGSYLMNRKGIPR